MCTVTEHAITRWIERVAPVARDGAMSAILEAQSVIDRAAAFGCDTVKLGNGARLRLVGDTVVTVLPKRVRQR